MSNTYFQFKQFKVEQDKCAMKVCTDSCIFGAWIPTDDNTKTILDIGCGTGLLSLMLAQRSHAKIDAVEINKAAFTQANQNCLNSVFADNITVLHQDISAYVADKKYNVIVCNPPFYENDMQSVLLEERMAKHNTTLTLESLFKKVKTLLSTDGKFAILLPYFRLQEAIKIADENRFYLEKELHIKQTPKHDFFRVCLLFNQNTASQSSTAYLTIRQQHNQYTTEFIELLKPYYLNL